MSGGTNTVTQNAAPPPAVMAAYQRLIDAATSQVLQTDSGGNVTGINQIPQYQGQLVAGMNDTQKTGIQAAADTFGSGNAYISNAQQYIGQGAAPTQVAGLSDYITNGITADDIKKFEQPNYDTVVNPVMDQIRNMDLQQATDLQGKAIGSGAFGSDRAGIAQATLANQQDLARNQTLSQLYQQNYTQALTAAQQQATQQLQGMGLQLNNDQSNAWRSANAGNQSLAAGQQYFDQRLQGADAAIRAGGLLQQQAQTELNVPYQQFIQQQASPYQQLNWLGGLTGGLGSGMGGGSTTTSPGPSAIGQIAGLGLSGIGAIGATGGFGANGWLTALLASEAGADAAAPAAAGAVAAAIKDGGRIHKDIGGPVIANSLVPNLTGLDYLKPIQMPRGGISIPHGAAPAPQQSSGLNASQALSLIKAGMGPSPKPQTQASLSPLPSRIPVISEKPSLDTVQSVDPIPMPDVEVSEYRRGGGIGTLPGANIGLNHLSWGGTPTDDNEEDDSDTLKQSSKGFGTEPASPWMTLAAAGLGMMASKNPRALGALGEGGLSGLDFAQKQQNAARQGNLAQAQADSLTANAAVKKQEAAINAAKFTGLQNFWATRGKSPQERGAVLGQTALDLSKSDALNGPDPEKGGDGGGGDMPAVTSPSAPSTPSVASATASPQSQPPIAAKVVASPDASQVPPAVAAQFDKYYKDLQEWGAATLMDPKEYQDSLMKIQAMDPRYKFVVSGAEARGRLPSDMALQRTGKDLDLRNTRLAPVTLSEGQANIDKVTGKTITSGTRIDNVNPTTGITTPAYIQPQLATGTGQQINTPSQQTNDGKPIVTKLGPALETSMKERTSNLEKEAADIDEKGTSSIGDNSLMDQMRAEAAQFKPGKFADTEAWARNWGSVLFPGDAENIKKLGAYQAFEKNAMQLTRVATRETSARAAVQEMTMIRNAMPQSTTSPEGLNLIMDQMQGTYDYNIAKKNYLANWRAAPENQGKTIEGAVHQFEQSVLPTAFMYARMAPERRATLINTLSQSESGKALLGKIRNQMTWAAQNGIMQ